MRPGGCLYMGRREPRGRASALPRRGPHLYFICPAELNSAGIKVLGPRPKTLGRRKAPPRRRRGPRRGRRIKRAPDVRRALTRTTTNFKDRQVLRRQHLPVPLCTFRGTHVPNHANVRVVDLHSLPRMFGPLHILLMHHDFLNEQPQQFRRQFLDVGVAPGF